MLNNSNPLDIKNSTADRREKGFSVLELIIAMVVFLIVTGSIYGILMVAQRGRTTVNSQTLLTKNVRLALNIIGRDTFNAGYSFPLNNSVSLQDDRIATLLGIPPDAGTVADTIPPVIAGNGITTNTFASPNTSTDQVTFLFKDSTFNLVGAVGPPDTRVSQSLDGTIAQSGGINQVTVTTGTNAACSVNDIFVVIGSSGSTLAVVTGLTNPNIVQFANTDVLGFNQNGSGSFFATQAGSGTMNRIKLVTYFVTTDGILTRREFATAAATTAQNYVDEPLVYGVTDLQIQYILADGTISNNPSAGANGIAGDGDDDQTKLYTVRQIRYTVNAKTLDLNPAGQPYTVTMTSTFGTRNLGYNPG